MELHNNELFDNRYYLEQRLGSGGFGEVWKAYDNIAKVYCAIKIHLKNNSEQSAQEIVDEYTRVMHIHHDNLLTPSFVGIAEDNVPYLVMELCEGDLSNRDLTENEIWHLVHDVAAGLKRLNANKRKKKKNDGSIIEVPDPIIHQDIKPANILLRSNGMYAITDFGISRHRQSTLSQDYESTRDYKVDKRMTVDYAAPERFTTGSVPASDIWSLGAMLYELVEGRRPFAEGGGNCLNPEIGLKVPIITREEYSKELKQLIFDCMNKVPQNRPTAAQILEYADRYLKGDHVKRPWIKHGNDKKSNIKIIIIVALIIVSSFIALTVLNGLKHEPIPSVSENSESVAIETPQRNDNNPNDTGEETNATNVESEKSIHQERTTPINETQHSTSQQVSTINLGYGTWQGPIKNGKPDGNGTVIISKACEVYGFTVAVGYRMKATFENGVLVIGRIYDENNNLVKTILP